MVFVENEIFDIYLKRWTSLDMFWALGLCEIDNYGKFVKISRIGDLGSLNYFVGTKPDSKKLEFFISVVKNALVSFPETARIDDIIPFFPMQRTYNALYDQNLLWILESIPCTRKRA